MLVQEESLTRSEGIETLRAACRVLRAAWEESLTRSEGIETESGCPIQAHGLWAEESLTRSEGIETAACQKNTILETGEESLTRSEGIETLLPQAGELEAHRRNH